MLFVKQLERLKQTTPSGMQSYGGSKSRLQEITRAESQTALKLGYGDSKSEKSQ